jgi:non-ribosomal peptide synthetase component F
VAILTPAEERRQLVEWNATAAGPRSEAVPDLVRERCAAQPDASAVTAEGLTITYGALDARSDATAVRLRAAGVTSGDVVALGDHPSIDFVVAALAAVKAGAATLMVDPDLPAERREFMLADSGASPPPATTAGHDTDAGGLSPVAPDRACSLQYTRGGKGVSICHRSAVNLATALAAAVDVSSADSVLVLPSTCARVPVVELWLPLIAGARIVIASAEDAADGRRLSRLIKSERVTFLHAAPSTWQMLLDTGLRSARSLRALSGGEPLSRELADRILERCRLLWNAYGAVETGFYATLARVEPNSPIGIGRPLANTRVYVVDAHRRPVPVGATGELLVAGDGVASGYLNRPDLGTSAFVECSPERTPAFRTGDLARWLADGSLRI